MPNFAELNRLVELGCTLFAATVQLGGLVLIVLGAFWEYKVNKAKEEK